MARNDGQASYPPVPAPSAIGTTSLAKRDLSYRWIINNAKEILEQLNEGDILKSPDFCVTLPLKINTSIYCHLRIYNKKRTAQLAGSFSVALQKTENESTTSWSSIIKEKIVLSNFTFTVIDLSTEKTLSRNTNTCNQRVIRSTKFVSVRSHLEKYIVGNGTLTIQVNASLLGPGIEALNEEEKLSQDKTPLYNGMKTLLDDKLFVDVTIKCGDEEFQAHKAVLASQSPVFKRMFETDMTEKASSLIDISDTDSKVVSEMLTYLYTGSVPNMDTMVEDLLIIANKYEISPLLLICEKKLKSSIGHANAVELLILADLHNAEHLKQACLNYIHQNSTEIHKTSGWKELKENCDGHAQLLMEIMEFTPQF